MAPSAVSFLVAVVVAQSVVNVYLFTAGSLWGSATRSAIGGSLSQARLPSLLCRCVCPACNASSTHAELRVVQGRWLPPKAWSAAEDPNASRARRDVTPTRSLVAEKEEVEAPSGDGGDEADAPENPHPDRFEPEHEGEHAPTQGGNGAWSLSSFPSLSLVPEAPRAPRALPLNRSAVELSGVLARLAPPEPALFPTQNELVLSLRRGGAHGPSGLAEANSWVTLCGFVRLSLDFRIEFVLDTGRLDIPLHLRYRWKEGERILVINDFTAVHGWSEAEFVQRDLSALADAHVRAVNFTVARGDRSDFFVTVNGQVLRRHVPRDSRAPTRLLVTGAIAVAAAYSSWSDDLSREPLSVAEASGAGTLPALARLAPPSGEYLLVVGILSKCDNYEQRAELRQSWLRWSQASQGNGMGTSRVMWRFIVAERQGARHRVHLDREHALWGDLLVLNHTDSYKLLPAKTMHFFQWLYAGASLARNFSFRYALKTDDDCFVRLDTVLRELHGRQPPPRRWWWSMFREGLPIKDRSSKWFEPDWEGEYPKWPSGAGHVLSWDLALWIGGEAAAGRLKLYANEDTTLGIALSTRRQTPITYEDDKRWHQEACTPTALSIFHLPVRPLFENAVTCGNPCRCAPS